MRSSKSSSSKNAWNDPSLPTRCGTSSRMVGNDPLLCPCGHSSSRDYSSNLTDTDKICRMRARRHGGALFYFYFYSTSPYSGFFRSTASILRSSDSEISRGLLGADTPDSGLFCGGDGFWGGSTFGSVFCTASGFGASFLAAIILASVFLECIFVLRWSVCIFFCRSVAERRQRYGSARRQFDFFSNRNPASAVLNGLWTSVGRGTGSRRGADDCGGGAERGAVLLAGETPPCAVPEAAEVAVRPMVLAMKWAQLAQG